MKKTLLSGVMALGLIFTGCSSEEPLVGPDGNGPLERDQTFYINLSISGDAVGGSRASAVDGNPVAEGDFDPGTGTESSVNNAYFVFYDKDGRVVGNIVPVDISSMTAVTTPVGATVEKSYQSVVEVEVKKGETVPTQVICYINPISPSTLGVDLNIIQTVSRSAVTTTADGNTYLAMSNSVYYPNNTDANGEPIIAVQIPDVARHTSEAAAEAALKAYQADPENNSGVVNIYVERYAAKLQFAAADPTVYKTCTRIFDYSTDDSQKSTVNKIELTFNPLYWAVNAEATTSYVIKSYRQEASGGGVLPNNYKYGDLNKRINPIYNDPTDPTGLDYNTELELAKSWVWNNRDYHRSYWAMSPAYFQKEYPEVSSDLQNITDINQKYISFEELKNGKYGWKVNSTEASKPHYFKETTVGSEALAADNPNAAVASVIYVGEYSMKINGVDVKVNGENPGFYTYMSGPVEGVDEDRPYIYFENEQGSVKSKVNGGESMLMRFLAQQTILYKKQVNAETGKEEYVRLNYRNAGDRATLEQIVEVAEVSKEVKQAYNPNSEEALKLQNNTRTLQFTSDADLTNVYILTGKGYETIVPDKQVSLETDQIRKTDANATLMRQVGYCYYYLKGEGYYSIPIKHLGWYRKGNRNRYDADGALLEEETLNWDLVRVGDFGLVRNHSYSINVTDILDLATGIGDEKNPIVPPYNSRKYYIAYSVNILKWALVPTQNAKL